MKKTVILILVALLMMTVILTACDEQPGSQQPSDSTEETIAPSAEAHIHAFEEWEVLRRPTCSDVGEKARYCSCGEKQTEVVAALEHTVVITEAVAPTCSATGLTEGKYCSVCNEVLVAQEEVAALGHTPGAEATCTNPQSCTVCGEQLASANGHTPSAESTCATNQTCLVCKIELAPALGHTETIDAAVAPTCSEAGKTEGSHCSACGKTLVAQETVATLPHTEVIDAAVAPTCIETGLTEGKHCSVCKEVLVKQETVKALGHTEVVDAAVASTCTETGLTEGAHCSECNEVLVAQAVIDALGHTLNSTIPPLSVTPPTATADGSIEYECFTCGDSFTEAIIPKPITLTSDNRDMIGYTGETGESLDIPAVFQNDGVWYRVTSIGVEAFRACDGLTSVIIPESVTRIENYAFYWCRDLTNIILPNSVKSIGLQAFYNCTGLTSIVIPVSVTSIGNNAFSGCIGLTSIAIPDSVTSIGNNTFSGCVGLTSVTISEGVTSIGNYVFHGCEGLTSITIPDSVTSIGYHAFTDCVSLTSVTIPDNVTSIGFGAFSYCTGLTSITIPDSLTSIDEYAFAGCSGLTSIIVTDGNPVYHSEGNCLIETESKKLLFGCKTSVIPDGVTTIANHAFVSCMGLTNIIIPDSVISIGEVAFAGCSDLISIIVSDGNPAYYSEGNCLIETESKILLLGCKTSVIPDGVTGIGNNAFNSCTGLTSITLPTGTTSIGNGAFAGCTSLTSIIIPNSITSIGEYAFGSCRSLTSITIPDSVTSIGEYAFEYCSNLTGITIPDSVTSIGRYAFWVCNNLTSVTIGNGVTQIDYSVFSCCRSLTSITIPASVTSISELAFNDCESLTSITISESVTSIGNHAFTDCVNLTDVYYTGTKAEWNEISIGKNNDCLTNATIHYSKCPDGHTKVNDAAVAPTCTESGLTAGAHCSVCGAVIVAQKFVPSLGHSYSSIETPPTCIKQGYTTHTCQCGDTYIDSYVDANGQHTFGDWQIEVPATCTEDGTSYRVCIVCAKQETKIVKARHTSSEFYSFGEYCGVQALGYTQCIECFIILSEFDHNYETTITHSTCTQQGQMVRTCKNCGTSFTETLPVSGHILGDWTVSTPTSCTTPGQKARSCTICNAIVETQEIAIVAHSYTSEVTAQGVVYTCSQCSDSYTVITTEYITLSFVCNGEKIIGDLQIAKGTYPSLPNPTKEGYVFSGWYLDEELTNKCLDSYSFGEDTILYSTWIAESITEQLSTNNLITQAPLNFTFTVTSEIELTDLNLAQYVFVTDLNGESPALYIVSTAEGVYTIGSTEYKAGMTYSVLLDEQVSFTDVVGTELWFIIERANTYDIQYNSETVLIPESGICAGYESEGNMFILTETDLLDAGDNAVVYRGENQSDIVMVFNVVAECTYESLYMYLIAEADCDAVFDKLDYYYSGDLNVENMVFDTNLEEELTQQVLRSSLYARFNYAATTFSGVTIGNYYYDLNNDPKPKVSFDAKGSTVTFSIKVVAEFARMHVDTREVDSIFTITMEINSELEFGIVAQTEGLKKASIVAEVDNTTKVNLFASINDEAHNKTELSYFKKFFDDAKKNGSFSELDGSSASSEKETPIGTLPIAGIPGITLSIKITNVFDFEAVGELGVSAQLDVSAKFGLQYVKGQGVSAIKTFDAEAKVTFYMMGKVTISDTLKFELNINALGVLNAYVNASVGPYVEVGGMTSATFSTTGVHSAVAGGYVDIGIKVKAEIGADAKIKVLWHTFTLFDEDLTLIDQNFILYSVGQKQVPIYFVKAKEDIDLAYNCGASVDLSDVLDTSVLIQDLTSMSKKTQNPECSYYLNGYYPGVYLTREGQLMLWKDQPEQTIVIKIVYGDIFKIATIRIKYSHSTVHVPYVAPTCTQDGNTEYTYCSLCTRILDGTMQTIKAPGHSYGEWYTIEPTCTENGAEKRDCNNCDYYEEQSIPANGHVPGDWMIDAEPTCAVEGSKHTECAVCGETLETDIIPVLPHMYELVVTEPTCTEQGYTTYTCAVCGNVSIDTYVNAKGHTEVVDVEKAPTCTENGLTEGKHCSVCNEVLVAQEVVDALGHTEVIDKAVVPTCTATGLAEGKHCSACNEVLVAQEVVPARGHTEVIDAAVAATCTTAGKTEGKHCSVCGEVLVTQEVIPARGHTEVIDAAVAATCTAAGKTEGKHCSVCNEVLVAQETVAAPGHTEVVDEAVAPTCTESGLTEGKHCSVCDRVLVPQTIVLATGHSYGEWYETITPTESQKGEKRRDCATCDAYETTILAELAHNHDNWDQVILEAVTPTCTETGLTQGLKCSGCSEILLAQEIVPALGHTEEVDEAIAPTCTETGLSEGKHCSVCNEVLVAQEVVDALGHTEIIDASVAPTCTETGLTEGKHCSVCAEVLVAQEVVDFLGHTEVVDSAKEPSCTEIGVTEGKHCSVCSEVLVVQEEIAALGHTNAIDTAVPPTCTATGLTEGKHCSVCGEVLVVQEEIAALGHTEVIDATVAPTCTETGLTEGKHCSVCGEVLVAQKVVNALGHTEVIDKAVAPTCAETGLREGKHCSICGEVLVAQEVLPATGHSFGKWVTIKEATTTEEGLQERLCECGWKETKTIEKLDIQGTIGIEYTMNNDGTSYSVTGVGTCTDTDIVISSTCNGLPVVSIGDSAFRGCTSLSNIKIPDSVTSIGANAFNGCTGLTRIVIPDSVTTIQSGLFNGCTSLTMITLPKSVTGIGARVFKNCTELTNINLPAGAYGIMDEAFYGCAKLMNITIPKGYKIIGENAFAGCSKLTSVTIPNTVKTIYRGAFKECTGLTSITIPNSVTTIEQSAFEGCAGLKTINIGSGVTRIGLWAFSDCDNLTTAVFSQTSGWKCIFPDDRFFFMDESLLKDTAKAASYLRSTSAFVYERISS